jgi:hypothetical protein
VTLHFEDPPPSRQYGPRTDHAAAAAELKARPGEWAVIARHMTPAAARTAAGRIRCGFPAAYKPAGSFDAAARTVDGEYRTYAMYRGESGDA